MTHPNDIRREDILGIVAFQSMTKDEFFKLAGDFVGKWKEDAKTDKNKAAVFIYIFGTVQGHVRNEMWFVKGDSIPAVSGEETAMHVLHPYTVNDVIANYFIGREDIPAWSIKTDWKIEKGGELQGTQTVRITPELRTRWETFLEEDRKQLERQREKDEQMARIKSDPNYEKYAKHLLEESGYKPGDEFFINMFLLHKMLEETPKEKLQADFDEIRGQIATEDDRDPQGHNYSPTVDEYFEGINPQFQYQKGYSEGAKALMDKTIEYLNKCDEVTVAEVINLMEKIYNNE